MAMQLFTGVNATALVPERHATVADLRTRTILDVVVKHLHDIARELEPPQ
jgi:hypothetical protein